MITVQNEAGSVIVTIAGRLDSTTASAAEPRVMKALTSGEGTVIDLIHTTYVASVGLRLILLVAKRARQAGIRLALCQLQPQVREVFEIGGFDTLLTLRDTRSEAIAFVTG